MRQLIDGTATACHHAVRVIEVPPSLSLRAYCVEITSRGSCTPPPFLAGGVELSPTQPAKKLNGVGSCAEAMPAAEQPFWSWCALPELTKLKIRAWAAVRDPSCMAPR